jgi:hypothetical protein
MSGLWFKLTSLALAIVLIVPILSACGGGNKKGEMPTFKVGNKWVYELKTPEGLYYTLTQEVTGTTEFTDASELTDWEALHHWDCYCFKWTYNPPCQFVADNSTMVLEEGTIWAEKATLNVYGDVTFGTQDGESGLWTTRYWYIYPKVPYWPLKMGKVIREVEYSETRLNGEDTIAYSETVFYTYEVESMEEITVAAGTFNCFKVVKYDDEGVKIETSWYSDKVKAKVKLIYHDSGDTRELKSYSV